MSTFGEILSRNRGIGPGFGLLRITLACLIMLAHTGWLTAGEPIVNEAAQLGGAAFFNLSLLKRPMSEALVPMFFALSGFLVTGSAVRLVKVGKFLSARLFRILPALGVEVTLSAIILGPIFTTYSLSEYFLDRSFYRYFLNIFGLITMQLPGVFDSNPWHSIVNINLWTLPAEFYCYLFICVALFTGVVLNRVIYTWGFVILSVILIGMNASSSIGAGDRMSSAVIFYCFFVGVLLFLWRDKIVYSKTGFAICVTLTYLAMLDKNLYIVSCIPLAYVAIYIGLTKLPAIPLLTYGDYSYGLYLYSFPISQALIASVPSLARHRFVFAVIAMTLSFAFAAFSWHVIEKPSLRLRARYTPAFKPEVAERPEFAHEAAIGETGKA